MSLVHVGHQLNISIYIFVNMEGSRHHYTHEYTVYLHTLLVVYANVRFLAPGHTQLYCYISLIKCI